MFLGGTISTPPASLRLRSTLNPQNAVTQSSSQATFPAAMQRKPPSYSISDEDLESRGFLLRRTTEGLNLDQLNSVFAAVGFPRRDTAKIEVALQHTDALLWVEYEKTRRPVAFARATGDGVFNAIIWDVVVDPSFQSCGLGKAVMERLIEDLQVKGICNIALYSEPRVLGFYRPLGFVSDPDGIKGMVFIRKQRNKK
ncbi:unknown protein [Arabidopsis thaliana]|jgi:ribosomal protein S18 acetylase RimI-like enzyme|uniref:GCN5-related N-acetyltransferase 1, chloroplastic n=4 Tax=Arabidopsis TaxID=3701 RepID=GNAT1_ARATH|nr:Acyl-CoA N-acyltransferases (NAT) superfamily protein [Arabidopsis thaliana]Q9C666.1 RecName: Full=GCN5-related N-acetyltransferase 1, chloroplastic; AltName: Full=Serotonin N-acetyl transferase 2; Short=AtSNAT2; Flags: Precursor [Arabidopsis thaliana]KAG7647559.1 GNAT domain [Arabidopsis thaliana x Arabidopsis arenosa]KAG7655498.1 GNAT domain [Arabidopsis suecica]AAG50691.1 unknown protein [Arabidopsis thaliana]AAO63282.1 At1g26220 [Arabidopsis thaliana]AEE30662.1 Acyl-CoA N-acyltransfera|eukprot:NP_173946.1 Acyl-CoA N-acyltransferases (NAT) superfamily protein [Arabidopsis thaliana]